MIQIDLCRTAEVHLLVLDVFFVHTGADGIIRFASPSRGGMAPTATLNGRSAEVFRIIQIAVIVMSTPIKLVRKMGV